MSWLVAFVLALCVPFGQLRTNVERIECCCPDQSHCKCPDHRGDHSGQPRLRSCHRTVHEGIAADTGVFVAHAVAMALAPAARALSPAYELAHPHDSPAPARPAAPS